MKKEIEEVTEVEVTKPEKQFNLTEAELRLIDQAFNDAASNSNCDKFVEELNALSYKLGLGSFDDGET